MIAARSDRAFLAVAALMFLLSILITVAWCGSMASMPGMPMPGGWRMSMAWMRMPDQSWAGLAGSFLGMWSVMMVAMMLPSLVPMLLRYRAAMTHAGQAAGLAWPTVCVGIGYLIVWAVLGVAVLAVGVALAMAEMQSSALSRAVPFAAGIVVLLAGAVQFTPWKRRHLACCREAPGFGSRLPADAGTALRQGLRYGFDCALCCANLIAILLVLGVMDLGAMAVVGLAITLERLVAWDRLVVRAIGAAALAVGLVLTTFAVIPSASTISWARTPTTASPKAPL